MVLSLFQARRREVSEQGDQLFLPKEVMRDPCLVTPAWDEGPGFGLIELDTLLFLAMQSPEGGNLHV